MSATLFDGLKAALNAPDLTEDQYSLRRDESFRDDRAVGFLASVHDAFVQARALEIAPDCVLQAVVVNLRARLAEFTKMHLPSDPHFKVGDDCGGLPDPEGDDVASDDLFSQHLIATVFTTSTAASRRLLLATARSIAPATARPIACASRPDLSRFVAQTAKPTHLTQLRLLGTGADWILLDQMVEFFINSALRLLLHSEGVRTKANDIAHDRLQAAQTRFREAMAIARLALTAPNETNLERALLSGYGYTRAFGASGWLLHLALETDGASPDNFSAPLAIVPLRTDRRLNLYYVAAQQDCNHAAEAVIKISDADGAVACKLVDIAILSTRTRTIDVFASVADAVERRDAREAEVALARLTDPSIATFALRRAVENSDWDVARALVERLRPLARTVGGLESDQQQASSVDFAPADDDDDEDEEEEAGDVDDGDAAPDKSGTQTTTSSVKWFTRATAVSHAEQEADAVVQLDSLPRAALLRLQRWAIDEMIADPALDLSALTRINANDAGARVCVCVKRIVA